MPRPVLEKHEQQRIIHYARLRGAVVYVLGTRRRRSDYPGTNQTPGLPDLWMMWPGLHGGSGISLWWEVKRQGGRRTPEQVAFGDLCSQTHTAYGYGTYDDFEAWVQGYLGQTARTA